MSLFETIKRYYDKGIYKRQHIAAFVRADKLTAEQYQDIVGEEYGV